MPPSVKLASDVDNARRNCIVRQSDQGGQKGWTADSMARVRIHLRDGINFVYLYFVPTFSVQVPITISIQLTEVAGDSYGKTRISFGSSPDCSVQYTRCLYVSQDPVWTSSVTRWSKRRIPAIELDERVKILPRRSRYLNEPALLSRSRSRLYGPHNMKTASDRLAQLSLSISASPGRSSS